MKRTLRGDLREMTQGKLGSKVDLGNTLAPLVPIYMEGSWWRDPGGQVGFAESQKPWQALKRHMVLPQPSGQGPLFIIFSYACQVLIEPLLHARHCAGCCTYSDEHNRSDSCPNGVYSLPEETNCYSWAKSTKEKWMMRGMMDGGEAS